MFEKSEDFTLSGKTEFMSSPVVGIGTIIDDGSIGDGPNPDDDTPQMSIEDIKVEEGSNAIFEVTLSNKADKEYTVTFNTVTNLSAEAEDIGSPIVVKDSKEL